MYSSLAKENQELRPKYKHNRPGFRGVRKRNSRYLVPIYKTEYTKQEIPRAGLIMTPGEMDLII